MRVLNINTYDYVGGAARAAYRLHKSLRSVGLTSAMLVQAKTTDDWSVIGPPSKKDQLFSRLRPALNKLPLLPYRNRKKNEFSTQQIPDGLLPRIRAWQPDIVNLNWITEGFVRIESLAQIPYPLVWTLMDMWAFTGGCHYSEECEGYKAACGACPQLGSNRKQDLSRSIWCRKSKAWSSLPLTIVSPSRWLADCVRQSSLMRTARIEVIPYGLDTWLYRPQNRKQAREILGLPQDKRLVLFGALAATTDLRKGWHLLQPALTQLSQTNLQDQIECLVFGASAPQSPLELDFKTHFLGRLQDDLSLSLVYSAADVMVVPSIQEAFGQTASEALACGIPVVTFAGTGVADIVDHQINGYLATPSSSKDLAQGILWILSNTENYANLQQCAREKAEREFSFETQGYRYTRLFEDILESWKPTRR